MPLSKAATQNAKIIQHLKMWDGISRIEALHLYQVGSLTKRIHELRQMGYPIISVRKTDPTGARYVRYHLTHVAEEEE